LYLLTLFLLLDGGVTRYLMIIKAPTLLQPRPEHYTFPSKFAYITLLLFSPKPFFKSEAILLNLRTAWFFE